MNIIWDKNIEPANQSEIERHLHPFLWLVPGWVDDLHLFTYGTDDSTSIASTTVKEQYRWVDLTLHPRWFTESNHCKQNSIIHELIHIHTNPLYDFSRNAIKRYAGDSDEGQRQIVFDEMEAYLERSTCDLASVIMARMQQ